MGTHRTCHSSRHPDPLHLASPFGPWMHTSLNDSKHRETLAVIKDVREPRHREEASTRLFAALDQVPEVIAILEAKDGAILYSNSLFSKVFGNPSPSSPEQRFLALFECRVLAAALGEACTGQAWTGRSALKTRDGRRITFEGTVSPVRTVEGVVESLVVRLRDISLEVEKDRHLRQAQKLDALGALAGGLAHDFNNLIGAMLQAAELIEMQLEPENPILKKLEIIQKVGGRAKELSTQILNFSRRTSEHWTPFDLTGLVAEVTSLLQATLPRNVELRTELTPGVRILGDPSQLHRVIMNLGLNGSQAMQPEGGLLSIQLQHVKAGQRVGDQPFPEPCVLLTIEDGGCGMDPPTLERIFEPFFTTKEAGRGTGLGLSVVYGIIQGHGGHLQVSSEPGKGSAFQIRLPVLQQRPMELDASPEAWRTSHPSQRVETPGVHQADPRMKKD